MEKQDVSFRVESKTAQVNDYVFPTWGGMKELIQTISHNDHGVRPNPEDYCCINGMYWQYKDMVVIRTIKH